MRLAPEWMTAATMMREGYTLAEIERQVRGQVLRRALKVEGGHMGRAARRLGVHRNTVTRMVEELGIDGDGGARIER